MADVPDAKVSLGKGGKWVGKRNDDNILFIVKRNFLDYKK